jgi:hypothetical protein
MADIKQAAKWMEEGKKVIRTYNGWDKFVFWESAGGSVYLDNDTLFLEDLIADDWEIFDE